MGRLEESSDRISTSLPTPCFSREERWARRGLLGKGVQITPSAAPATYTSVKIVLQLPSSYLSYYQH